jgi:hypothetical protein
MHQAYHFLFSDIQTNNSYQPPSFKYICELTNDHNYKIEKNQHAQNIELPRLLCHNPHP